MFTAARPIRSFEDIALQIQTAVTSGKLREGDRLPNERELGSMFGVSRATLREALRVLEGAGVVVIRRGANGGVFVSEPKADQVASALNALIRFRHATAAELAEFRTSFEAQTAYWAAQRITAEQAEQLVQTAARYAELAADDTTPWATLVDQDVSFHEQVAGAAHNQIRLAIMLAIHQVFRTVSLQLESMADHKWRLDQAGELQAIARAIARGNSRQAQRLMHKHVEVSSAFEVAYEREFPNHTD